MSPRVLFGALARAEVVTWGFLLLGMVVKHAIGGSEVGVQVAGPVHGFVFLAFSLTTVVVAVDARWSARRTLVGLVAAVVPFATVPFEHAVERAGLLPGRWRLREERGHGVGERLLGVGLRAPVRTGTVALLGLVLVFGGLVAAGPPTQWIG